MNSGPAKVTAIASASGMNFRAWMKVTKEREPKTTREISQCCYTPPSSFHVPARVSSMAIRGSATRLRIMMIWVAS